MKLKNMAVLSPLFLAACTATTTFQASVEDAELRINQKPAINLNDATEQTYYATSFGQYAFELSQEGKEPMYGMVPLKFNGGYLALDILFFAPALFYNLREVYPFYEFDTENAVIRFKKKESDPWQTYYPSQAEVERARSYFNKES